MLVEKIEIFIAVSDRGPDEFLLPVAVQVEFGEKARIADQPVQILVFIKIIVIVQMGE